MRTREAIFFRSWEAERWEKMIEAARAEVAHLGAVAVSYREDLDAILARQMELSAMLDAAARAGGLLSARDITSIRAEIAELRARLERHP